MKCFLTRFLFALSVALAFSAVFAGAGNAGTTGQKNLAVGTGTIAGFGDPMVHVNAQTNPNTGVTSGRFYIRYPGGTAQNPGAVFEVGGSVSCLTVPPLPGNHAAAGGTIERIKGSPPAIFGPTAIGNEVLINVLDNGSPGTFDQANEGQVPGASTNCPTGSTLPIKQGNYTVTADPPLDVLGSLDALIADAETAANCSASVVCSGTGVFVLP